MTWNIRKAKLVIITAMIDLNSFQDLINSPFKEEAFLVVIVCFDSKRGACLRLLFLAAKGRWSCMKYLYWFVEPLSSAHL